MTFTLFIWIFAITILFIISNSIAHAAGAREKPQAFKDVYKQAYREGYFDGYSDKEWKGASVDD